MLQQTQQPKKSSPPCLSSSQRRQFSRVLGRDDGKRSAPFSSQWILNLVVPNKRCPTLFLSRVCRRPAYLLWRILKIKLQRRGSWPWRRCWLFSFPAGFIASLPFDMLQHTRFPYCNNEFELKKKKKRRWKGSNCFNSRQKWNQCCLVSCFLS